MTTTTPVDPLSDLNVEELRIHYSRDFCYRDVPDAAPGVAEQTEQPPADPNPTK